MQEQADDVAVAVVDCLQALGPLCPCDLYAILKENYENDVILRELWEETHTVPEWVDWLQIERGQKFLYRYLVPNLVGLALQGFLVGTAVGALHLHILYDLWLLTALDHCWGNRSARADERFLRQRASEAIS